MHLWYDLFQVILQLDLSHCWRLTSVIFTFGVSGSFHPVILQFTGITSRKSVTGYVQIVHSLPNLPYRFQGSNSGIVVKPNVNVEALQPQLLFNGRDLVVYSWHRGHCDHFLLVAIA